MSKSNRAEWAKRVERWGDSGLTAKEFAAETGLNASTLSYWKWRLGADKGGRSSKSGARPRRTPRSTPKRDRSSPTFVEVAAPAASSTAVVELVTPSDLRVRVPVGFDEDTLVRVLRVVGAPQ